MTGRDQPEGDALISNSAPLGSIGLILGAGGPGRWLRWDRGPVLGCEGQEQPPLAAGRLHDSGWSTANVGVMTVKDRPSVPSATDRAAGCPGRPRVIFSERE